MNMFYQDKLLKMNLQMFSDPEPEPTPEPKDEPSKPTPPKPELKYTDEDVDKIIAKRLDRWQKDQEAKQKEAERLAAMSAEERANEEIKKLKAQIKTYEQAETRHAMAAQVEKELKEANLAASADMVNMLVRETAEETNAAIKAYVANMEAMQKQWDVERSKGKSKPAATATSLPDADTMPTKDQILRMTYRDHVAFKQAHPEEYKRIMGK
nr:MAG TPA: Major capsid protein [Caudoviricetes sp.]